MFSVIVWRAAHAGYLPENDPLCSDMTAELLRFSALAPADLSRLKDRVEALA
jgi:hypothetical protein